MRATLLALAVAVAGCAPAPASHTVAAFPISDSTVSFFEPDAGDCRWRAVDPVTNVDVVLARLPVTCDLARVSWRPDGGQAVFHSNTTEVADAFLFDAATATVTALPRPPNPSASYAWEEDTGALVLTCSMDLRSLLERVRARLMQQPQSTADTLVAHRLAGSRWRRLDDLPSSEVVMSDDIVTDGVDFPRQWAPRAADARALPQPPSGVWLGVGDPQGLFWISVAGGQPVGPLVHLDERGRRLPETGPAALGAIDLQVHGAFALRSDASTGEHPRLYRGGEAGPIFSSDLARDAVLWPRPSAAFCPAPRNDCLCPSNEDPGCAETFTTRRRYEFFDP